MSEQQVKAKSAEFSETSQVFAVVLTGGIAAGKSVISDLFRDLGVPVIDTDLIARELVEPGMPALRSIKEAFGEDYLDSAGRLDRQKMRSAIFSNPALKGRLEGILHPQIQREVRRRVSNLETAYCLVVIPLYSGSNHYQWINRVLVVDVPEEIQIIRVMNRDRVSRQKANAILASQLSRTERLAVADDVISNEGTVDLLKAQVENLHVKYVGLANSP